MALTTIPQSLISSNGSKNYFSLSNANGDLETNSLLPWTTFSTTLSNGVPTTVTTGGTGAFTLAINSSAPLTGNYDLIVTKPALNVVGTGFISGVLTIDREDLAKVLFGQISYSSSSANIDASGSSTQSLEIWIYNVNGAYWIQPSGYRGMNSNGSPSKVTYNFQTDSSASNNQYRIAVITAQTSTLGYAVEFDNFQLGPQTVVTGAAMTDWQSYTPTGSWNVNTTYTGKWRRVGDSMEMQAQLSLAGAPNSTALSVNLPSGFSIDSNKFPNGNGAGTLVLGLGGSLRSAVSNSTLTWVYNGATSIYASAMNASGTFETDNGVNATIPVTWGSGDIIYLSAKFPIVGWSSNVQQSSDSDQRTLALSYGLATGQVMTAGGTIKFDTLFSDSAGLYTIATGVTKVNTSGLYAIAMEGSASGGISPYLQINGVSKGYFYSAASGAGSGLLIRQLNAGDSFSILSDTAVTLGGSAPQGMVTNLNVFRLSGSAVVQATESVNCRVYLSAASTAVTAATVIPFDAKAFDSHNAFNLATKTYILPVSGVYEISILNQSSAGNAWYVKVNGGTYAYVSPSSAFTSGTLNYKGVAGDQLQIFTDGTQNISGSTTNGQLSSANFKRIGN